MFSGCDKGVHKFHPRYDSALPKGFPMDRLESILFWKGLHEPADAMIDSLKDQTYICISVSAVEKL